jgi:glycosyltransferase involved in cell wall biosynthesis
MKNILTNLSVVMPCLNEEKTVGLCVKKALSGMNKAHLKGEVIICDNGSSDNSVKIAKQSGAKVIIEKQKGYGSAYLTGIKCAKNNWIVIGDSDGTYDFGEIYKFVKPLQKGYELVIGSRLKGKIRKGSMPLLNRYLGTPILNFFLRIFYKINISDSQCGMRAFTKKAFKQMNLQTTGMEFASEMLVKASQEKLKIAEVPISYLKRISPTKLSRFRDAWRHIRFMLLYAPTYLFLIPGIIFMGIGLIGVITIALGPVWFLNRTLDFHTMIFASMLTLLGYQVIMLGIYAKTFSWLEGFDNEGLVITSTLKYFRLEIGLIMGALLSLIGFFIGLITFVRWAETGFGSLWAIRPVILSMTLIILGVEIIFSSFFLSILGIERNKN